MAYDQAQIRRYIVKSFGVEELRTFCFDYFPGVYEELSDGMTKSRKVELLLAACMRNGWMPELVAALAREKPGPFVDTLLAQAPEELTEPTAPTGPIVLNPRQIFISHAHQDAELAHWLAQKLNDHGWQSWIAPQSIRPGEKWVEAINRGLLESGVFVLLLTAASVASRWVQSETNVAIQREHQGKLKFVPLKTTPGDIPNVPPLWQSYQQVAFDTDQAAGLEALLTELEPGKMAQLARAYNTLQNAMQAAAWEQAEAAAEQIEAAYPGYRDVAQLRTEVAAKRIRAQRQEHRLGTLYMQLKSALRAGDWDEALDVGEQILSVDRLYRDVKQLMTTATVERQNQKRQARLSRLYLQLQTAFEMENWRDVVRYGDQIVVLDANYLDVGALLAAANHKLQPVTGTRPARAVVPTWAWWGGGLLLLLLLAWGISGMLGGGTDDSEATQTAEALASVVETTPSSTPQPEAVATEVTIIVANTPGAISDLDPNAPPPQPTLGSKWQRPADGMMMVYVPGGTFPMGSDNGASDEQRVHDVTLDSFWIDQTEVTNKQFAAFVAETVYVTTAEEAGGAYTYADEWQFTEGADWQHPYGPESDLAGRDDHPVVLVSWQDADAYCEWVGGQLPTEAQWEYAARGKERLIYPWGNEFDGEIANFCDVNCEFDHKNVDFDDNFARTAPVGSYPDGASWVDALDMAGNVWEWVRDRYDSDYYANSPANNPQGPDSGQSKVLRGGAWGDFDGFLRAANRNYSEPTFSGNSIGLRCAQE